MEEAGTGEVAKVLRAWPGELRVAWLVRSLSQRKENARRLLIGTTEGFDHDEFRIIRRLHDPIALADSDERAGLS